MKAFGDEPNALFFVYDLLVEVVKTQPFQGWGYGFESHTGYQYILL